jgi:hypothetical protein
MHKHERAYMCMQHSMYHAQDEGEMQQRCHLVLSPTHMVAHIHQCVHKGKIHWSMCVKQTHTFAVHTFDTGPVTFSIAACC